MRQNIKNFVVISSKTLTINEPVYEFGSLRVPEQIEFADLRPLFPNKEYVGCDMREGLGVDKILNLHEIDLADETAGAVLSFDTLEHVEDPRRAMQEIHRILKADGIAVITSVMNFPIHDYPHDYWRFTPEAFKSILKPFDNCFVGCQGDEDFPHTVIGIGFKGDMPDISEFTSQYTAWKNHDKWSFRQIVLKLTPPILLPIVAWLYRGYVRIFR